AKPNSGLPAEDNPERPVSVSYFRVFTFPLSMSHHFSQAGDFSLPSELQQQPAHQPVPASQLSPH
ncbi:MAG: hypothetical protein ACK48Y_09465, partial [Planctomyces sp.]